MSAMPPEWSARSLLARFAVYGHFYEREAAGGALWQLRDRLESFEHALLKRDAINRADLMR